MFAEDISEDFSDLTFAGFYSISGYLQNLRGRLLSSEKFSEVFTLWVFTLKPFSAYNPFKTKLKEAVIRDGPNTVSDSIRLQTSSSVSFLPSPSSGERAQWVPLSLLFVCKSELTEFCSQNSPRLPRNSVRAQWILFSETVRSKQKSACFLF